VLCSQAKPMRVLLSIKPVFAALIFSGKKEFEYRRTIFRNPQVKTVVVYASAPEKKVVGEFEVADVHYDDIHTLWAKTGGRGGISRETFLDYFSGKTSGFAIEIGEVRYYSQPRHLKEMFNVRPPQSFVYLDTRNANTAKDEVRHFS